ncbi:protein required for cell viability [Aspergillus steynii IBT 23096]|uniref:Protein required for cell viability n=1 Tax=Aspergillus steynii IBT 23096 TaxID=1392250 RepID=A0A2I2G3U2_9EURO|nr:protein required for cell viability [Aspergillus steynii IBT 23096]PLB47541.1 protein required for cell viability [Aspergillus steynii IBT 23096]
MGDLQAARDAFNTADEFLTPVLDREELQKSQGGSLLDILAQSIPDTPLDDAARRSVVITRALDILARIHSAFVSPVNDAEEPRLSAEDAALEDAKRRRWTHALLDLVAIEGVNPSLSSGVGIPLQQRMISILPAGVIAQDQKLAKSLPENEQLLDRIMSTVSEIVLDVRPSIQPLIRGRILSDIISGVAELAFNSKYLQNDKKEWYREAFTNIIKDTPSSVLLPTLSNFLQASPAPWFKATISTQLSRVPLRENGLVQTVFFLASQFSPSLGQGSQPEASTGPHFTVQAIMQTSRLLSSVPQGMDPVEYFSTIAPQLLSLIDGDDPDLRKTAAYTVGTGILGKRAFGAPGTIGHSIFLEPIFKTLTARLENSSKSWMRQPNDGDEVLPQHVLVNESLLRRAVDRLGSLVLQPPNPALVKRVVYPILVPLWGLACFALEQQHTILHEKIMMVLRTYFGISVGFQPLKKLVDYMLWDGDSSWTYTIQPKHGLSLTIRKNENPGQLNVVHLMDTLQSRTKLFVSLLGADPSSEERTGDVFLYVSERWLVKPSAREFPDELQLPQANDGSTDTMRKIVSAKLAEALLENFKDVLSRRPLRVLELVKQIIDGELNSDDIAKKKAKAQSSAKVSLSSLANIVDTDDTGREDAATEADSTESLPAVFTLLSTVLASPEFSASQENIPVLEAIKGSLDELITYLPQSLAKQGTTASMLLEIQIASPAEGGREKSSSEISDFDTHRRALTNLNSDLPPVQAEGFSLLSDLIKKASPVLDIQSTLTLLLSIITDPSETASKDEFIYLNAIKLVGTLASRHPRTVVKTLVERYADRSEAATLDQRLKIGESLMRTVQDLGEALTGETAKALGDGMIAVAGRRAHKPEAQKSRKQQLEKERREREREERKNRDPPMAEGWKSSISSLTPKEQEQAKAALDDVDSDSESPEQATHSANIISAWAAGASSDEEPDDLRVRASALSVLATAVQTNVVGLGPSVVASAVDLALSTMTLEPDPESAILRRASAILLLDILKAMEASRERGGKNAIDFGFSLSDDGAGNSWTASANTRGPSTVGNIPHMVRSLAFVESRETDTIVRGHVRVLLESLEAWLEKALMWGIGAHEGDGAAEPRLGLGDRIAGLQVDPLAGRSGGRPKIEEIE